MISKAPRGAEAVTLWDAVETLATSGVAELKRRLGAPSPTSPDPEHRPASATGLGEPRARPRPCDGNTPPRRQRGGHRYPRSARLNETLREVIAEELVRIDDERLAFVTITSIDVDNELNRAIVLLRLARRARRATTPIIEVLEEHRRRIQSSINRQIRAKKTPSSTSAPTT